MASLEDLLEIKNNSKLVELISEDDYDFLSDVKEISSVDLNKIPKSSNYLYQLYIRRSESLNIEYQEIYHTNPDVMKCYSSLLYNVVGPSGIVVGYTKELVN